MFINLLMITVIEYYKEIIGLLGQMVQQQKVIINLLTYISALIYAGMSNNPIYPHAQAIQSSYDTLHKHTLHKYKKNNKLYLTTFVRLRVRL